MTPRCPECALPIARYVEPFIGGCWQHHQCAGCRAHLHLRRTSAGILVRPATLPCVPLPAVASQRLRARFLDACRRVATLLPSQRVEPGMASIDEEPTRP